MPFSAAALCGFELKTWYFGGGQLEAFIKIEALNLFTAEALANLSHSI